VEDLMGAGIGDLFTIRVAGNVCMTDETGSVDYAVAHLHVPLIVVLGHTGCGAVTAAVNRSPEHGSITRLLAHIDEVVDDVRHDHPGLEGDALLAAAIEANVWRSVEDLIKHSTSIRDALHQNRLRIQGAIYDLDTGEVRWLGPHPQQDQLADQSHDDGFE
jgi:carbonic anhydrase